MLLLISCGNIYEMSLAQYSKARASQVFTEEERKELQALFRSLLALTLQDGSCADVQNSLNDSQALLDAEDKYDLKLFFIYTELLSVSGRDIIAAPGAKESAERKVALSVISVWKEAAASTQEVDYVIFKIRKCHPRDYNL